jgi:hypothetical protein
MSGVSRLESAMSNGELQPIDRRKNVSFMAAVPNENYEDNQRRHEPLKGIEDEDIDEENEQNEQNEYVEEEKIPEIVPKKVRPKSGYTGRSYLRPSSSVLKKNEYVTHITKTPTISRNTSAAAKRFGVAGSSLHPRPYTAK